MALETMLRSNPESSTEKTLQLEVDLVFTVRKNFAEFKSHFQMMNFNQHLLGYIKGINRQGPGERPVLSRAVFLVVCIRQAAIL